MRTFLLLLLLSLPLSAQRFPPCALVSSKAPAAGGGPASFSDDFSGTLGKWTIEDGTWDINSGALRSTEGGFANQEIIFTDDELNTTQGYMRFTRGDDGSFPRAVFRFTSAAAGYYAIEISNTAVQWYYYPSVGGSGSAISSSTSVTTGIGTAIGITWTGTGTSTRVRVWIGPTGNTPNAVDDWGGDTTPDADYTDDPGTPVNSGAKVGFGGAQSAANTMKFDNFFGGDI